MKRERWGSLLVREKYREEMSVTSISYSNNNNNNKCLLCIFGNIKNTLQAKFHSNSVERELKTSTEMGLMSDRLASEVAAQAKVDDISKECFV